MQKRAALLTALALCIGLAAAAADKPPLKIAMLSGAFEYKSDKSLAILKKHLETTLKATCTILQAKKRQGDDVPGMEALDDADLMVLFMRRQGLKGDQLERFKRYAAAGKPIVGVRTASHAVQTWLVFDKEVLGGNYKGHFGHGEGTIVSLRHERLGHPVLRGVLPFRSKGGMYRNTGLATDCDILAYGEIRMVPKDKPNAPPTVHREPIAWTRLYKGGRIFYTSLGHQDDFKDPAFLRLLTNAVLWTTHREPAP